MHSHIYSNTMLFNSIEFALFLPLVFAVYWFVTNRKLGVQNLFLVGVSYLFYGWWDWRFLLLIAFTTGASYLSGVWIERARNNHKTKNAKIIAASNIVLNLLVLCLFKYFNFFGENLNRLFELFGFALDWVTLDILLPVGISFYTFQALSYTIDVYKRKIEPTHDPVSFFAYVSFFPQLVAGPIERATNLLPQFYHKRQFDYAQAVSGSRQILWGLFKKMVVADNCALIANQIFDNYTDMSSSTLVVGAVMFSFQIYGDFSGYSDIAIGTARLFGFRLMQNFNYPYFSRDIAEFWRRWHISLTTWFRDYIYIPLGGSRGGKWSSFRNTMIIFLVSGLWHGANWTFVVWGVYHALLFLPLLLLGANRKFAQGVVAQNTILPSLKEVALMLSTFAMALVGWIIFRAESISQAWGYLTSICTPSLFSRPEIIGSKAMLFVVLLTVGEWVGRGHLFALEAMPSKAWIRYSIYLGLMLLISFWAGESESFIYFQF